MATESLPRTATLSWRWFIALVLLEAVCLAGYVALSQAGESGIGLAFIVIPVQMLVWVLLAGSDQALLLVLAALLPLSGLELLPSTYYVNLLYPATLGALVVFRVLESASGSQGGGSALQRTDSTLLGLLVLCVAASGLHAFAMGWRPGAVLRPSLNALYFVAAVWLFAVTPSSIGRVRTIIAVLVFSTAVTCCLLPVMPNPVGEVGTLGGKVIRAPFGDANMNTIGGMVAVVIPFALVLMLEARRWPVRAAMAVVSLVLMIVLVVSKSRGAWLGVGVGVIYLLIRARSFGLAALLGGGAALVMSLDLLGQTVASRLADTSIRDPSLWGRFLLWKYAIVVARANWLVGVGMENFRYVKHVFGYPLPMSGSLQYNAHNIYLELLADLGVVGVASFVALNVRALFGLEKVARRNGPGLLSAGLGAAIIAYCVHGTMDALTWHHGAFLLFGMVLGLSYSVRRLASAAPVAAESGHRASAVFP